MSNQVSAKKANGNADYRLLDDKLNPTKPADIPSRRVWMSWILHTAQIVGYLMRVNLSVAITVMQPEFHWSEDVKQFALSAYYIGYAIGNCIIALLGTRVSPKIQLAGGMMISSILTACLPFIADQYYLFVACRIVIGIFGATVSPGCYAMMAKWAPPEERGSLLAIVVSGNCMGTCLSFFVAGYLSHLWWPSVFYVFAAVGVLWSAFFWICAFDTPAQSWFVSNEEAEYIEEALAAKQKLAADVEKATSKGEPTEEEEEDKYFLLKILFSSHIPWVLLINQVAGNWNQYTLLSELPTFFVHRFGVDVKKAGMVSVFPFFLLFWVTIGAGVFCDNLIKKYGYKTIRVRKFAQILGLVGCSAMLLLSNSFKNLLVTVAVMTFGISFYGFKQSGHPPNMLDVFPASCVGSFYAVANIVGTLGGILSPIIIGKILGDDIESLTDDEMQFRWTKVFLVNLGIAAFASSLFTIFGTTKKLSLKKK